MAGKSDLVNSIVDSIETASRLPVYDGWGVAAGEDAADAAQSAAPAPGGSLALDPLGGAAG
ncbi:MAG TPA: hypothetical protein VF771_20760 [Longimicrobiaceae bacterium]